MLCRGCYLHCDTLKTESGKYEAVIKGMIYQNRKVGSIDIKTRNTARA